MFHVPSNSFIWQHGAQGGRRVCEVLPTPFFFVFILVVLCTVKRPSGCWMTRSHDNSVYLHYNHYLHYTQYCEQYLHCSNVYILYISHVFQRLLRLSVPLLNANFAHANMPATYTSSYKYIVYILYLCVFIFCASGNLQIKSFFAWCKLCAYDNKTSWILSMICAG